MHIKWRYHLSLLAVCWIWGLAFIAVKVVLEEASFITVNLVRFFIASLALFPVLLAYQGHRPRLSNLDRARILLAGICAVYGYHLSVNYGETLVPAGTAGLLANTTPIFAAVLAHFFLGEKLGMWRIGGIIFALAGVVVITSYGSGETIAAGRLQGIAFVILAAFSWAVYTVVLRPLTEAHGVIFVTSYSIIVGTLLQLPLLAAGGCRQDLGTLSASSWGWLIFLGLGSTVIGYFLYAAGVRGLGATVAAYYTYLIAPIAMFWGWILLGETINAAILLGAAMIIMGLLAVSRDGYRLEREEKTGERDQLWD
ncbi:MAG: DMT family transporter [Actinobacteria bacterium]|nr:DMT family transporter [Actinomycetota bacterium]